MTLLAATQGLPLNGLLIVAPALFVLFCLAMHYSKTPGQRIANMVLGLVFAVLMILGIVLGVKPTPGSWLDENFGWVVIASAPIGAAFGILLAVACRGLSKTKSEQ